VTKQQLVGANGSVAELERAELAAIYELGQAINANLALDQTATAALQGILKAVSPSHGVKGRRVERAIVAPCRQYLAATSSTDRPAVRPAADVRRSRDRHGSGQSAGSRTQKP
jgi:hypothetical protein